MAERAGSGQVRIEPWAEGDLDLLRQLNAPEMTEHLGGPETDEQVLARHRRYVAIERAGAVGIGRVFKVVLAERTAVGSVCFWESDWQGGGVFEIGWGVLPAFQRRGIAGAAVAACVDVARAAGRHRFVHAFPSVGNPASNATCRKAGFSFVGECEVDYPVGSLMRCNNWRLDLTAPPGGAVGAAG